MKEDRKIDNILAGILILSIILMVILIFMFVNLNNKKVKKGIPIIQDTFIIENSEEVISNTMRSTTTVSSDFSDEIKNVATKVIPYINKNLLQNESENMQNFYKDRKDYLLQFLGIESEEEFLNFCKALKNTKCNLNELVKAMYEKGTVEYNSKGFSSRVKIEDKDGLYFIIKFSKSNDKNSKYKYEVIEE